MAASDLSDIPDDMPTGKYCPCKNCQISREEGRQEIRYLIKKLHTNVVKDKAEFDYCLSCSKQYPCPTIEALDSSESK
jgi:hypothetical protein